MAIEKTIEIKTDTKGAEQGFDKLADAIKELNDTFSKFSKTTEEGLEDISKTSKNTESGVGRISKGFRGLGIAIKATGIGLFVAAAKKLGEVFMQNQTIVDTFNTAFEAISIAFNDFVNFIVNNGGAVVDFFKAIFENPVESIKSFGKAIRANIIERLKSALDVLGFLSSAVKKVFSGDFKGALEDVKAAGKESIDVITGVNNTVDKASEFVEKTAKAVKDYATETFNAAKANVQLNKQAELAAVINQGLIEKYDRQAEQLRQVRDDESKSIEDRIKANQDLAKVLDEQEKAMKANAAIAVQAAATELAKNKESVELQKAYQEALNEQAAIEAQITGFRSEQQTNTNSLLREQKDLQNELALIGKSEREIERLELQQDYEAKKLLIEREITDEDQKNQMLLALQKDFTAKINALDEDAAKNGIKWAKMTQDEKLAYAQKGLQGLAQNLGKETAAGKAAAISSALISTYQGATDSYKSLAKIPVIGPALGFAAAAAATVAGLANVKAIAKTKTPGDKGGTAIPSIATPTKPTATPTPPQFNIVGASETNQLADAIGSQTQQPVQAYVVANDVTTAQSLENNIVEGATLG